jgi:predicted transcriptional regulator
MGHRTGGSSPFGWLGGRRRPGAPSLGARELTVMQVLWQDGALSAQQVLECLGEGELSVNTVCTTLERLMRKGLLARTRRGRTHFYEPIVDRSTLIGMMLRDIGEEIAGGDLAPMVSGFVDFLGSDPRGEAELRRLADPATARERGDG